MSGPIKKLALTTSGGKISGLTWQAIAQILPSPWSSEVLHETRTCMDRKQERFNILEPTFPKG